MFQLIHPADDGGASIYSDGFKSAQDLFLKYPHSFSILSRYCVGGACGFIKPIHPFPIFNFIDDVLFQVRWNSCDRAPFFYNLEETEMIYRAMFHFNEILNINMVEIKLKEDELIGMDNWRILHGRTSFQGYRRMVGCYYGSDDYFAKVRELGLDSCEVDLLEE